MRLCLNNISVSFGDNEVLKNINFEVNTKDKIDLDKIDIYATGYANQMLDYGKAYKFSIKVNEGTNELYMYAYNEFNLPIVSDYECTVTENNIKLNIPYDKHLSCQVLKDILSSLLQYSVNFLNEHNLVEKNFLNGYLLSLLFCRNPRLHTVFSCPVCHKTLQFLHL